MHGTGARFNLAPDFATSDASTGQCFRGADNRRAPMRRASIDWLGGSLFALWGRRPRRREVFAMSTGSI